MFEDVRTYMRAGIEALSSGGSDDLAAALRARAQDFADQVSGLASGFLQWSAEARGVLMAEVRDVVARQVREMGLASQREVEALAERVRRLEAKARAAKGSPTKARPAKRTTAKRASKAGSSKRSGPRGGQAARR